MTGDKDKSYRNTSRVTFSVCSGDGIALSQEQCHQRFVMLSGASITHIYGFDHFIFVIGIMTKRGTFFYRKFRIPNTQFRYSELQ
jgi:hypothetical protein